MIKEGKIWGETTTFFSGPTASAHYLRILAGGFCSEHRHLLKSNIFFVIRGDLKIFIWKEDGSRPLDEVTLRAGETTVVPPGVFHKFEALTDVEAIELYYVELIESDINRRSSGGIS